MCLRENLRVLRCPRFCFPRAVSASSPPPRDLSRRVATSSPRVKVKKSAAENRGLPACLFSRGRQRLHGRGCASLLAPPPRPASFAFPRFRFAAHASSRPHQLAPQPMSPEILPKRASSPRLRPRLSADALRLGARRLPVLARR